MSSLHPLEVSQAQMRAMVACAMDHIVDALDPDGGARLPAGQTNWDVAAAMCEAELPERGEPIEGLLAALFERVIPASLNTTAPGHMAYVPGGGLFPTAVADLIAAAVNRYTGFTEAAPGLAQLEANVIAWFCRMLRLPPTAGGLLTSGGSMANLLAIVTARSERLSAESLPRGILYTSAEAHHCVRKAAMIAGLSPDQLRALPADAEGRLRAAAVRDAIDRDRAMGLVPFLIVATAGTTGIGSVDELPALADLAEREQLWLHVDAAYGGFFALTERGRVALTGIERADSVTLDPHKSLFLSLGTGSLVVRDQRVLRRTFSGRGAYLESTSTHDLVDLCDLGLELSRPARGLRVWLPLKMFGAAAFGDALDEKLDLARRAAQLLRRVPDIELVSTTELSLFAFRARPDSLRGAALDELNRRLLARVNARRRVELSGTMTRAGFVLRMCVLSFRTHAAEIEAAVEDIAASLRELRPATRRAPSDASRAPAAGSAP